MLSPRQG